MFRTTFFILLTFNLLVCPLRCLSCQTQAGENEACVTTACSCCQESSDAESPQSGNTSDEDCSCPNCICEGATLQAGPEISAVESLTAFTCRATPLGDVCGRPSLFQLTWKNRPQRFNSGRDALVAFQSWLN